MTLTYTYDGSPLGFDIPPTKLNLPSRAEIGSIDIGGVSPEDPNAGLELVGWRPFYVEESACSQPRLFTGWVADRNTGRSFDQTQWVGPDERILDTTISGLNAVFGMRIIWDTDGKRPEETMDARLAWLLSSSYLSGLIADTGHVLTGLTLMMDAADYRKSFPDAVLQDLSGRSATLINYFAFWDPVAAAVGLFYDYVGAATFDCTISISNAGDDDGATIFEPDYDARLQRTPETVWSDVIVEYANGSVHVYAASTATNFIRRGTTISKPYTGKSSTAVAQGQNFLSSHAVEVDRITCTLTVPASVVGLIQAGMRMPVKFTNLTGYTSGTSMRIVACTPTPTDDHASHYAVALELVAPKIVPAVALLGSLYFEGADFYGPPGPIVSWRTNGDIDPSVVGFSVVGLPNPTVGPIAYTPCVGHAGFAWIGIQVNADALVNIDHYGEFGGVADTGATVSVSILQNGVAISTQNQSWGGGLGAWYGHFAFNLTGIVVANGDVFEVSYSPVGWAGFWYYAAVPGTDPAHAHLIVSGSSTSLPVVGAPVTPPTLGTTVMAETPTPTPSGTTTTFTVASAYLPDSLQVTVDGIVIDSSAVTEDAAAGTFTLSWAPDADEKIVASYVVG